MTRPCFLGYRGCMAYRCVIFDFDGTLADTLDETLSIMNELAAEYGFRPMKSHEIGGVRHMRVGEFRRYLGIPAWRLPRLLIEGKRRLGQRMEKIAPIRGVPEMLRELRGMVPVLGILTSNSEENVAAFLDRHNLVPFDFILSSRKLLGKAKHLRRIVKRRGFAHEETLYVGDELRDIEAAHAAEIPVAAASWGFNSPTSLHAAMPDHMLDAPAELLGLCSLKS